MNTTLRNLLEMTTLNPSDWPVLGDHLQELSFFGGDWRPTVDQIKAMRAIVLAGAKPGGEMVAWNMGQAALLADAWWRDNVASPTPTFAWAMLEVLFGVKRPCK